MAPSYRYGRDAVFQVSSALARKLLLRELRTSAEFSCLSRERIVRLLETAGVPEAERDRLDAGLAVAGLEAVSVWVDELHLERRDDGQDVVVLDGVSIGGPPPELVPPVPPVPLAAVSGDVSTKLADAIKAANDLRAVVAAWIDSRFDRKERR
jgi:hypothetical protein